MKNTILILLISQLLTTYSFGQNRNGQIDLSKIPVPQSHYQFEYNFDVSSDPGSWAKQKPGLHVAFGTTDELYLRSEVPLQGMNSKMWEGTGWRGERLNAQVLVWSPDSIKQIRFQVSDLVNSNEKSISKENIKINLIRYVVSNFPSGATNFGCDVSLDSAWLLPDRFETFERFDLPGKSVRPVWISCEIPSETETGEYNGTIEIQSLKEKYNLAVTIHVQQQILPKPHEWNFRLDLWQNPWVIARYYNVVPWSAEHKELLRNHLKLYADAGGKYITTYAVNSPWSDNSYTIEGTMIEWIKTKNGSWRFDYSIFDQYVEIAMETGIDKAITIYTPLPWGHRFRYLDEISGNYIYEVWSPASAEYKIFWNLFLTDLKTHLDHKGWFDRSYLGINENPLEYTLAAARVIKDHSKDWKITYAGEWQKELSSLLDDYSPVITSEPTMEEIKQRAVNGFTTSFYVCCNPPQPNSFIFSPPVESRYIAWYASAYGYNGFLRWAYDAWPFDPVRDARHTLWPAGDCFLVYPGGFSSIRFEKLREGIVDYEKILILREMASKSSNLNVIKLMNDLDKHLLTFINERDYDIAKMTEAVRIGNKLIRDLSIEFGRTR